MKTKTVALALLTLLGCQKTTHEEIEEVTASRWQGSIVLAYVQAFLDSDLDGYSDIDEQALGTDPNDPLSYPGMPVIIDEISRGNLESFNQHEVEIIVLPKTLPNGGIVGETVLTGYEPETLKKLGITSETLKRYGLSFDSGFSIEAVMPEGMPKPGKGAEKPPVTVKVAGIDVALISDDTILGGGATNTETWAEKARKLAEENRKRAEEAKQASADAGWKDFSVHKNAAEEVTKATIAEGVANALTWVASDQNKPDGGTKKYVDQDIAPVIALTKAHFEIAWYKLHGGWVSRPVNPNSGSGPRDGLTPPPQVLGNPNGPIILLDPEQTEYPLKHSIIVFPPVKPKNKKEQNTNFGPTIIEHINFGSGKIGGGPSTGDPHEDPN